MRMPLVLASALLALGIAAPVVAAQEPVDDDPAATAQTDDPGCPDCGEVADEGPVDPDDAAVDDETDDADEDDGDGAATRGSIEEALDRDRVDGGAFRAKTPGRLRVELRSLDGRVLGRLVARPRRPGSVALLVRLNRTGEELLADSEGAVELRLTTRFSKHGSARAASSTRTLRLTS